MPWVLTQPSSLASRFSVHSAKCCREQSESAAFGKWSMLVEPPAPVLYFLFTLRMVGVLVSNTVAAEFVQNCLQLACGIAPESPWLFPCLLSPSVSCFLSVRDTAQSVQVIEIFEKRYDYLSYLSAYFSCIYPWKARPDVRDLKKNLELICITEQSKCLLPVFPRRRYAHQMLVHLMKPWVLHFRAVGTCSAQSTCKSCGIWSITLFCSLVLRSPVCLLPFMYFLF